MVLIGASICGVYNLLYSPTSISASPSPSSTPTHSISTSTQSPTPQPTNSPSASVISSLSTPIPTTTSSPSTPSPSTNPTSTSTPVLPLTPSPTINPTLTPMPTPTPVSVPTTMTVVDGAGRNVTLTVPVNRVISVNSGLTEMLCALGCEDKIVGRDASSTLPPSVLKVAVVGDNSYLPNVELILELEPDVVFADSMLTYNDVLMNQIESAGIPIFIADPSDPEPTKHSNETIVDFSCKLMQNLATIVGSQDVADEYVSYVQYYNNLIKKRIETVTLEQRPKVMLEWYEPYNTFVTPGLDQAGGVNIAENQTVYAPVLSAEFVIEQNPDIIIYMISSLLHDETDFKIARDAILTRPGLEDVNAIKNGNVYICDWVIRGGVHSIVGYLYWAKWCQPDYFADIDPVAIQAEIDQKFFGTTFSGIYAYP